MCRIVMEEEFVMEEETVEPAHQYLDLQVNQSIYIYKDGECCNDTVYVNHVVNGGTYEVVGNAVNIHHTIDVELLVNDDVVGIHDGINTISRVIELGDMELLNVRYSTPCNIQTSIFINRIG